MIRRALLASPFLLLAALFGWMFDSYYWQHVTCFNSEGRCYVSADGIVYHNTSVYWAIPAVVFLVAGLALLFAKGRKPEPQPPET